MPEMWMSVAQAATVLKVHPRTIERRISSGKIESRRSDGGAVEVSIPMSDTADASPRNNQFDSETLETVKELADRQVDIAAGSASALVRIAQQTAERAEQDLIYVRQDLDAARHDLTSVRRESRVAWSVVGGMMILMMLAIGWATHSMTRTSADVRQLTDKVRQAQDLANQSQKVVDQTRQEANRIADGAKSDIDHAAATKMEIEKQLQAQTIARARAEGELTAYKSDLATRLTQLHAESPTTRPTTFIERITAAISEP